MDLDTLLKKLSTKEKIALCEGADFWHTRDLSDQELPALTMADGPHGLRKQKKAGDMLGVDPAVPATCFPSAVTTACSWDEALLSDIGRAIGEEAVGEGVDLVLGPGVNLKRGPLCGRNFEYFSEDPLLAGKLGAAWVRGLQSAGPGACVKHFACNSQEHKRFASDSVLDERTLRELYLTAFEIVVRESRPAAVMSAYNKINGVHCAENRELLTDILREEWGFDGAVVTDWGGMSDRIAAFGAGCDLMMPGGSGYMAGACRRAAEAGALDGADLDRSARRVLALMDRAVKTHRTAPAADMEVHHALARRAAAESAVLLKNDGDLLPLDEKSPVVFIGHMAGDMRYQGSGSSRIDPWRLTQPTDACPEIPFVPGCGENGDTSRELLDQAVQAARRASAAVVFVGLPERFESEGFDRPHMGLPVGHNALVEAVAGANPNTAVVLLCGSPVELPWADKVRAILYLGLPGQAGGQAAADLLFGRAIPSGKLAESWPIRYGDCPSAGFYAGKRRDAHYREGLYVGYRYYTSARVPVRFPFGHGLSYTTFTYSGLTIRGREVRCRVQNTGSRPGKETVQLYVAPPSGQGYRPALELRAFTKLSLEPGKVREVRFTLEDQAFALWAEGWQVPGGAYRVYVGPSSQDLPLSGEITLPGSVPAALTAAPDWYQHPQGTPSHRDWEALLGRPVAEEIPPPPRKGEFTMEHTVLEMKETSRFMALVFRGIELGVSASFGWRRDYSDPRFRMMMTSAADAPLRSMRINAGIRLHLLEAALAFANGHVLRGLRELLRWN